MWFTPCLALAKLLWLCYCGYSKIATASRLLVTVKNVVVAFTRNGVTRETQGSRQDGEKNCCRQESQNNLNVFNGTSTSVQPKY